MSLKQKLAGLVAALRQMARGLVGGIAACRSGAQRQLTPGIVAVVAALTLLWRFRSRVTAAVVTGSVAGVLAYHSGPLVSGLLCGLGSALLMVSGFLLAPWRRLNRTQAT